MEGLLHWDFWVIRIMPLAVFYLGALLDFFNKGKIQFWWKNYLPLLLISPLALASVLFPMVKQQVPYLYFFLAIWLLLLNWNRIGLNLFALGAVLNMLVVVSNGNRMPAAPDFDRRQQDYQVITTETLFVLLGDQIVIGGYLVSIGDVCLAVGSFIFLIQQIYLLNKKAE